MAKRKKGKKKEKTKVPGSEGKQNVGWSKLRKDRTYMRGKGKKHRAKYSPVRDAMRRAKHKPVPGKPFAGDDTPVYYVIDKRTGKPACDKVWYSKSAIPKKYKNTKIYQIKHGWV